MHGEARARRRQSLLDVGLRIIRAEKGAGHAVIGGHRLRGCPLNMVVGRQRGTDRAAGIARRRLNPDIVELAVAQHLAVGDAVQRDAAGEAQIAASRSACARLRVSRSTASSSTAWIEAAMSM